MPTDEEARAGHRIISKAGADSSTQTDRNPRAPNHNKDKTRLVDLHWQYATVAEAEADTVVRGEVVWVVSLNAPFFFVAGSTAIVDHVQVLSGPLGFGRWLRGTVVIVLDPNCVVFTDAAGHLATDPIAPFEYFPAATSPIPNIPFLVHRGTLYVDRVGGSTSGSEMFFLIPGNADGNGHLSVNAAVTMGSGPGLSPLLARLDFSDFINNGVGSTASNALAAFRTNNGGFRITTPAAGRVNLSAFVGEALEFGVSASGSVPIRQLWLDSSGNVSLSSLVGATPELVKTSAAGLLSRAAAGTDYTLANLTAGSVVVSGGGAALTQDNANAFYDIVNHRLFLRSGGTPTAAAGAPLTIAGSSAANDAITLTQAATQDITKTNGRLGVGTGDANGVDILTSGTPRISVSAAGAVDIASLAGLANGVTTSDASGVVQKVPTLSAVDNPGSSLVNLTATSGRALALGAGGTDDLLRIRTTGVLVASAYGSGATGNPVTADASGVVAKLASMQLIDVSGDSTARAASGVDLALAADGSSTPHVALRRGTGHPSIRTEHNQRIRFLDPIGDFSTVRPSTFGDLGMQTRTGRPECWTGDGAGAVYDVATMADLLLCWGLEYSTSCGSDWPVLSIPGVQVHHPGTDNIGILLDQNYSTIDVVVMVYSNTMNADVTPQIMVDETFQSNLPAILSGCADKTTSHGFLSFGIGGLNVGRTIAVRLSSATTTAGRCLYMFRVRLSP